MSEQQTSNISSARPLRWPFLVAGLAALAVAALRTILGGPSDLAALERELGGNNIIGIVRVNWHSLNVIFASFAVALFLAARAPRAAAQAIAILAAIAFGATCIILLIVSAQQTGSPFTHYPWIPLSLTAALSAFAAWRARD